MVGGQNYRRGERMRLWPKKMMRQREQSDMQDVVSKLYQENKHLLLKNIDELIDLHDNEGHPLLQHQGDQNEGSTGKVDCFFLYLLVLHFKPKIILEAGTYVGTTAKFMAHAAKEYGGVVHTCDPRDFFVPNNKYDNLFFHNAMSTAVLDDFFEEGVQVDMAFYDSPSQSLARELSGEHTAPLKKVISENFIFAAHDYYGGNGETKKGHTAVAAAQHLFNHDKHDLFVPPFETYNSGHKIPDLDFGINGCTTCILPKDFC
tara:strand:+ start:966 stop:1745 length:780 start_codon:yes stop_codon:yes gene_type:complete